MKHPDLDKQNQPNILLITADQFRWDALGCMGNDVIQTPNLDRLAARGVLFRNAFSSRLLHGFEHADLMESGRILAQFDPKGEKQGIEDYFDYLKRVGYAGYSRAHGIGLNYCCGLVLWW